MTDREADAAAEPKPTVLCTRCARPPRDTDDRLAWVMIGEDEICPGCLTMTDKERLHGSR